MTPRAPVRIKQTLNTRQPDLRVLTNQVHKPRNLSAIIRSCDVFGLAKYACGDSDDGDGGVAECVVRLFDHSFGNPAVA